jgi:hypothetical protein
MKHRQQRHNSLSALHGELPALRRHYCEIYSRRRRAARHAYLFDKEDAGTHHPGIQLARGCRGCGSAGCQARTKWLASIFQLPAASLLRSAEIAAAHFRTPLEAGEKSLFR